MPRKRHVSRNELGYHTTPVDFVMPRKRHVSRNLLVLYPHTFYQVMPRKRHVSRNLKCDAPDKYATCHASQEACE